MKMNYEIVLVTASNENEASNIAMDLLEKRPVACANAIHCIRSTYRWKGKIEDTQETLFLMKTRRTLFRKIVSRISKIHSYEVPEVLALDVTAGNVPHLEWLMKETKT